MPTIINGTVSPRRLRNADLRPREFLTGEEVERLRKACADRPGRYPHRDGTMIPLAYRHGLPVSELVARAGTCSTSTRACRTCAA